MIIIREVAPLVEAAAVVMAVAADMMTEEIIMDVDVILMTIQDEVTIQGVTIVNHMTDIETGTIMTIFYDVIEHFIQIATTWLWFLSNRLSILW